MDIVVVGAGKAGSLHYRAYSQLARAGRLDRGRIAFVDPARRPGPELAELLRRDGLDPQVHGSRDELPPAAKESVIVDLCLPSRILAPQLIEWWEAGYRRFLIEKPFTVAPEHAAGVRRALADSSAVLVRNYLYSKVHAEVRGLIGLYDLDPVLCVTNFSKDRLGDNLRGRGAADAGQPTVYEVEMPHQLYIGADLVGEPEELEYAEDRDPTSAPDGTPLRLGEGVLVGRSVRGAAFVHYSNLHHPAVVRSLDVFTRGGLSIHATYAPICEEFADIKAGVMLCRGATVLGKRLFTADDNMLGMVSAAHARLSDPEPARVDPEEVLRASELIRTAVASAPLRRPAAAAGRTDLLQEWVGQSFALGLESGAGQAFLAYLERRQRARLAGVLPALDPAFPVPVPVTGTGPGAGRRAAPEVLVG
ncbi:hypothetical protein Kpho02_30710 [Kitasatospora phosalacinea]|uniref:Gfo/Idh/MocA-like oxidoreductase N-terminal domain-containing protein n=1 Tax=Kitasatospora phosalacinea TaxID=2065 RepID=A0A9W6V304_9ACTN|nr:hypothetical protein [Kitasatospora phosalacinea]GLW70772.1 hypothetical protein Kpho02_30710 [Kitasatospora phosalacinea]